ncbi:hypothetical protein G7085_09630 [Tessaracoccus sp. HDW20]|nr:hypothetical protein [Tessaracoccus coleopterorum]
MALQRGGLCVEAAGEDHVTQVADKVLGGADELERIVTDPFPSGVRS